jgi:hypothetical protein
MSKHQRCEAPFPPSCALDKRRLLAKFQAQSQVAADSDDEQTAYIAHVPGDPTLPLCPSNINTHLSTHLETPLLDELYDILWLVAKSTDVNIDPLHTQRVKGRSVIPTEDPRLHLTWARGKIYVKPIPVCLMNYDFWKIYLPPSDQRAEWDAVYAPDALIPFDRSIAMGFLRSYALLVPNHLDFQLAKQSLLLPDSVNWQEWSLFISHFRHLDDEAVAKRYHYGQLRLSWLNWAVRIFRPRHARTWWFYEIPNWSATEFLAQISVPVVFVFAVVSLALSSMQVALSVPQQGTGGLEIKEELLRNVGWIFWIFSISVILLVALALTLLVCIPLTVLLSQIAWGFRHRRIGNGG